MSASIRCAHAGSRRSRRSGTRSASSSQASSVASRSAWTRPQLGVERGDLLVVGGVRGQLLVQLASRWSSLPTCRSSRASSFLRARTRARLAADCAAGRLSRPSAPVAVRRRDGCAARAGAGAERAQVLVDAAGQVRPAARRRTSPYHRVGDPLDQVPVVAGHDHRARPASRAGPPATARVSVSRSLVGSSSSSTFGSAASSRSSCSRRRSPPDRSPTGVHSRRVGEAEHLGELGRGQLPVAELDPLGDLLDRLQHPQVPGQLGELLGQERRPARSSRRTQPAAVGRDARRRAAAAAWSCRRRWRRAMRDPVARADLPGQVVEDRLGRRRCSVTSSRS